MLAFFLTIEEWWEARINKLFLNDISNLEMYFGNKFFGNDVEIFMVVIYCDPYESIKQRIKYRVEKKELLLDVVIDYTKLINLEESKRKNFVIDRLVDEVLKIKEMKKFKKISFDFDKFTSELKKFYGIE